MHALLTTELAHALRSLRRAPLYTLAVVGLLGVGLGLDVAAFSVVHRVLLRPLPVFEEEQLVQLRYRSRESGRELRVSAVEIGEWAEQVASLSGVAGYTGSELNVRLDETTRRVAGAAVTRGFFELLGMPAVAGRLFVDSEHLGGGPSAVLLAESAWRQHFGTDPAAIGRTLEISGVAFEVVGVVPDGAPIGSKPEVWMPLQVDPASTGRGQRVLTALGRLGPGSKLEALRAELEVVSGRLEQAHPRENAELLVVAEPLRERLTRALRPALLGVFAAAGLLLLLVVVNVVFLFLVRTERRWGELSVRAALGASRPAVARLLLLELGILAIASGAVGVLVAGAGLDVFRGLGLASAANLDDLGLSAPVVAYVLGLCGLVVLVAGLGLGLRLRGEGLRQGLGAGGGRTPSRRGWWLRQGVVLTEVALAVALLVGAGLALRSVRGLLTVDAGFDPQQIVTASLVFPSAEYPPGSPKLATYLHEAIEALEAVPGIEQAASTILPPLLGTIEREVAIESAEPQPPRRVSLRAVSESYFETLGLAILRGRPFSAGEGIPEVVVNEALEEELLGGRSALGRRLQLSGEAESFEVVGIAQGERASLEKPPTPTIYLAHERQLWPYATLVARGEGNVAALTETLRRTVQGLDRGVAVFDVEPLEPSLEGSVARERTVAALLAIFATLALAIACAGVYVVFSLAVASRRRELGIRLSLGASPAEIHWEVAREGLRNSLLGALVGAFAAWQLSGLLEGVLFGVERGDPLTLAGAIGIILASSALACWVPARRAGRVDPVVVLRGE